jgi:hypothetical protein
MNATLSQGSSVSITLAQGDFVALQNAASGKARIELTSGSRKSTVIVDAHAGNKVYGPFDAGSISIAALAGSLKYSFGPNPNANDGGVPSLSAKDAEAVSRSLLPFGALRRPITAVGTYAGTGSAVTVNVGWIPDLFIAKDVSAATIAVWQAPHYAGWLGKSNGFTNVAGLGSAAAGIVFNADGTVTIGTDASINTNTNNYEWFALKDNGSNSVIACNHSGDDQSTRTLRYFAGKNPKAVIFKRDSTQHAVIAVKGKSARRQEGSAATDATINDDGTITIGQGADLNQWTSNLGEGVLAMAFADGAQGVYVTTYTGTGASKPLLTPFDEIEAILIFPRASTTVGGAFWTSRLAAGATLGLEAVTASTVGAQAITAVNQGRITLGTGGRCNASGTEYVLFAFRKNRQGAIQESAITSRPLRSTRHTVLSAAAYINCGTSDTLNINGAISLEFWGAHFFSTPTSYPTSATNNNNTALQAPLIWRSNGADGVSGNVSYGLMVMPAQSTGTANPVGVAVTDIFDLPQNAGSYDVDDNQPWCTGTPMMHRTLQHVIATHDGKGFWRVYLNGKLTKERHRNMLLASPARPNVQSTSGHTLAINGRKRETTPEMTAYTLAFYGARVYRRELSEKEAVGNFNSLFSDNSDTAAEDYVEQWLADNAAGTTLFASRHSANNGTIVGTYAHEGT